MAVSSRCCGVVFTSLWRTIQAIHCFLLSSPAPDHSSPNDEVAEKSRLLSHFTAEERAGCVPKDRENLVRRRGQADSEEVLQEEEKRLQACGTLSETPAEMRKAVKFSDAVERSETKIVQNALKASAHTNAEFQQSEAYSQSGIPCSVLESSPETPEEIQKFKTFSEISVHPQVQEPCTQMKASPYPTPRKITDDMQTPGTVFATSIKGLSKGNARIRSQYVRGVLNPIENFQLDDLKESNSYLPSMLDGEDENLLQPEDSTSSSAQQSCENAATEEIKRKTSLHG